MIRFFDLLAIDRTRSLPQQLATAAAKWPSEEVQPIHRRCVRQHRRLSRPDGLPAGLSRLQGRLLGRRRRTVGISAEMHISAPTATLAAGRWCWRRCRTSRSSCSRRAAFPRRFRVTRECRRPARVVIQGLPVEIRLPPGFRLAAAQAGEQARRAASCPTSTTTVAPFDATDPDSLQIMLRDFDPSSIFVRINVRMTPEFDFVIDTQMPITIGPCVFLDLPCEALHDLQLIPSPRLQHDGRDPRRVGASLPRRGAALFDDPRHRTPSARSSSIAKRNRWRRLSSASPRRGPPADPRRSAGAERDRADHRRHRVPGVHVAAADSGALPARPAPRHRRSRSARGRGVRARDRACRDSHPQLASQDLPLRHPDHDRASRPSARSKPVLVAGSDPQNNWSFGFDYNDDGVLIATAIIPVEDRVRLFRILNREVRLIGLKARLLALRARSAARRR